MKNNFVKGFLAHIEDADESFFGDILGVIDPFWSKRPGEFPDGSLEDAARIIGNYAAFHILGDVEMAMRKTESPIERLLLLALYITAHQHGDRVVFRCDGEYTGYLRLHGDGFVIEPQAAIGSYRADFLVEFTCELPDVIEGRPTKEWPIRTYHRKLIVECDGHDFHEKTKEQAKRDKQRDRELAKVGYTVFHFTGSEVWRDPFKCAVEAIKHLEAVTAEKP